MTGQASRWKRMAKFGLFLIAGALGFVTDAAVFFGLLYGLGLGPAWCRIIASCVAITVTWALNRSLAFKRDRVDAASVEFAKYFLASLTGAFANLLVLLAIIPFDSAAYHIPAYIFSAAAGLAVNYMLYSRAVFYGRAMNMPGQKRD